MANFFKKNAKFILIIYAVILFATLISGLFYMTSLANVHVYYSVDSETGVISFGSQDQIASTGQNNLQLFKYFGTKNENLPEGLGYDTDPNNGKQYSTYFADAGYARIVYDFQVAMSDYNTQIILFSIIGLICFCILMIFSNHSRKIYYKSNLYAGILMPGIVSVYTIIMMIQNFSLMGVFHDNAGLFRTVYVLQNPKISDKDKGNMTDYQLILDNSTGFNDSCYWIQTLFFALVLVYSIFLIAYTIFRYKDSTKRRNEIIERAVQNND